MTTPKVSHLSYSLLRKHLGVYEWFNAMDERMQNEVILAQIYTRSSSHGTAGHLGYTVVDYLVNELCQWEMGSLSDEELDKRIKAQKSAEENGFYTSLTADLESPKEYDDDIPF
jgi:hypothetical protein